MRTIFDIETIAKPLAEIEPLIPDFDPAAVKLGNLKDPEKVKAKLAEAEASHRENFIRDAALNPATSFCKMAGFMDEDGDSLVCVLEPNRGIVNTLEAYAQSGDLGRVDIVPRKSEEDFLRVVMAKIITSIADESDLVSFFGNSWDLPYLFRRAWMNGVNVSTARLKRGRYFRDNIIDLYELWGFAERFPSTGGLKGLAKTLGCANEKNGDGMMFGELYAKDPTEALAYLVNDLKVTSECADRMGV